MVGYLRYCRRHRVGKPDWFICRGRLHHLYVRMGGSNWQKFGVYCSRCGYLNRVTVLAPVVAPVPPHSHDRTFLGGHDNHLRAIATRQGQMWVPVGIACTLCGAFLPELTYQPVVPPLTEPA